MVPVPMRRRRHPPGPKRPGRSWLRIALWTLAGALVMPVILVASLRWINPPSSAFMEQYRIGRWFSPKGPPLTHCWVDFEQISPAMALAVVAAEDQKFPEHHGFDLEAMQAAYKSNQKGRKTKGASTITQQTAKNLFLWGGRSYLRKGIEAYLTLWIEWLMPKRRILELYLNVAEFAPGVYGVCAAAPQLFGRSAGKLSSSQAALMAAVLPNPRRMHADRPSAYVRKRGAAIERDMRELGQDYLKGLR